MLSPLGETYGNDIQSAAKTLVKRTSRGHGGLQSVGNICMVQVPNPGIIKVT